MDIAILDYSTAEVHLLKNTPFTEDTQTEEIEEYLEKEGYKLSEISFMFHFNISFKYA